MKLNATPNGSLTPALSRNRRRPNSRAAWLGLALLLILPMWAQAQTSGAFSTQSGTVSFVSDAPLETINAKSSTLAAAISPANRTFAFSVSIASFEGFNSELQREHFNENYMETPKFPYGTFKGKIIEEVNLTQNGTYTVRAKGILSIHGVAKERTINATVVVNNGSMTISSKFDVLLADHNIAIPSIVTPKISKTINVTVNCTLKKP